MDDPDVEIYGRQICDRTGLATGTVHPILVRLESRGWLTMRVEATDPRLAGRPRRRYCQLTASGRVEAELVLRQTESHPVEAAPYESSLAGFRLRSDGSLPEARDLGAFGITASARMILPTQRAIVVSETSPGAFPPYIRRDHDNDLHQAIAAGGLIVVHGPSGSGKTRSVFEAIRSWPDRVLLIPRTATALRDLARSDFPLSDAIIWLDDLGITADDDLDSVTVSRLCSFERGDVAIIATMRAYESRELPIPRSVIAVDATLSTAERCQPAAHRRADPRTAHASRQAPAQIPLWFAGGVQAQERWRQMAREAGPGGATTIGESIIAIAVRLHHLGLRGIPRQLVDELVPPTLPHDLQGRLTPRRLQAGWAAATQRLPGTDAACVEGDDLRGYTAHGYLVDTTPPGTPPAHCWDTIVRHTELRDLVRLGSVAARHQLTEYAASAYRRAALAADPEATTRLGILLEVSGQAEQAERMLRSAALTHDHPAAATRLGLRRLRQGHEQKAAIWFQRAARAGDLSAVTQLAGILDGQGEEDQALRFWEQAAEAGDLSAMRQLGDHFSNNGNETEAQLWWRRLGAVTGDSTAMVELAVIFEKNEPDRPGRTMVAQRRRRRRRHRDLPAWNWQSRGQTDVPSRNPIESRR